MRISKSLRPFLFWPDRTLLCYSAHRLVASIDTFRPGPGAKRRWFPTTPTRCSAASRRANRPHTHNTRAAHLTPPSHVGQLNSPSGHAVRTFGVRRRGRHACRNSGSVGINPVARSHKEAGTARANSIDPAAAAHFVRRGCAPAP
jgi:hypothetical protein